MIKNGSKPKILVIETSKFGHLFSFWSPIKTLDFGQFHLDSPAGDSLYVFSNSSHYNYNNINKIIQSLFFFTVKNTNIKDTKSF
jgi:hypothetical protein